MKAAPFEYERPGDLDAAIALCSHTDVVAKILAGGQSLGPMLNLRLAQPDLLVDITHLAELKRIEESRDAITLGACITHADIEDGRVPDVTQGALPEVARDIAYRAVRNRGTIGGSLSHADPAADWISCLAAMGAEVLMHGPSGRRALAVNALMTGAFETALDIGEVVEAVRLPRFSASARWGYCKIARKTGEMAQAIGAVLHDPERGVFRAVLGATESRPVVFADAAQLLPKRRLDPSDVDGGIAVQELQAVGMIDAIDQRLHVVALKRAIARAAAS